MAGGVANTLNVFRGGAVGFIDWLGGARTTARPLVPGSFQTARDVVQGSIHRRDSHTYAPNRAKSPASDPGPPSKRISPVPTGEPDSWRCKPRRQGSGNVLQRRRATHAPAGRHSSLR